MTERSILSKLARRLKALGWLDSIKAGEPEMDASIKLYQSFHGLKADGVPGPVTLNHLSLPRFCGLPDRIEVEGAAISQWPRGYAVKWSIQRYLPELSQADQKDTIQFLCEETAMLCDWPWVYVADARRANVYLDIADLGGAGGTLAQAQLPPPGAGESTRLFLQSDLRDRWAIFDGPSTNGRLDWRRVAWHELLHNGGLGHGPSGNLNAPVYSEAIWRPQVWDIQQLIARYGPPLSEPGPPPAPADKSWAVHEAELKAKANAMGYRVTKISA